MYDGIVAWWPVISPPSEYSEEAALYVDMIRSASRRPVREVLELGSGGGNNASHMKRAFAPTRRPHRVDQTFPDREVYLVTTLGQQGAKSQP